MPPPPQKNRSPPLDSSPETNTPGGISTVFDQVAYDQLRIEISAGPNGGSRLAVTAESYVEQVSRRGREQTERPSRPEVEADAKLVLQGCGSALAPRADRVPSVN